MLNKDNDEEIRNLFLFISSEKQSSNIEKVHVNQLKFGIDNYLYGISDDIKIKLKRELTSIAKSDFVSIEEFKQLWKGNFNFDYSFSVKDTTNQVFNLVSDQLGRDRLTDKITEKDVLELIKDLNLNYISKEELNAKKNELNGINLNNFIKLEKNYNNIDDEEEIRAAKLEEWKALKLKEIAKELVECIDLDGDGIVNKKDFEFLITEYLNDKST